MAGTALDAVNAALSGEPTPDPTPVEETPAPEGEAPEGETPEGDETPEGEGETPEGETPEGEGEGEEGDGEEKGPNGERERNPDGTWKKSEPKEGEKTEAKTEKPAKKEPDAINDPIPKELKAETQQRIRTLIDTTKTVTQERDKFKADFDYIIQGVQATGATPQQYGETLSWLALFNSGDPAQQEKALELVETVAERLALVLGKDRAVNDPLKDHQDLQDAVRAGKTTVEFAREVARNRNAQNFRREVTTSTQQEHQQQQQAAQELAQARNDLTALEQTLRSTDKDYDAKRAALVPILQPIFQTIPPKQWKSHFEQAYRNLKVTAPAASSGTKVPANQPLRAGKNPAGGQTKAPTSMLDAISGALAGMK